MPGAVNLSLKGNTTSTSIPADDDPDYAQIIENLGYDGDIEFQIFGDQDKVDCLGATRDSNGCIVENKDDKPNPQALLFEFAGDKKAIRHVLYNCTFTKPDIESATKGDKAETKTDKLSIKARPALDTGDIKYKTSDATPTSVYNNWYNIVTLKNTTIGAQISPDDIVFDKKTANQSDAVINIMPANSETLTSIKNGETTLSATTAYTVSTNVVTIKKTYLATLAIGKTLLTFEFSTGVTKTLEVTVIDTTAA
jgi:phi13 family phage major tail protein